MITLFSCLMPSCKGVAIILISSLLLISHRSRQCEMAAQLSLLWFSYHGLFLMSCRKSSRQRERGSQCLRWVSAANELFEVMTVHKLQHISGLFCSTDHRISRCTVYVLYILCNASQVVSPLLYLWLLCDHVCWQTTYANMCSKQYNNSQIPYDINA